MEQTVTYNKAPLVELIVEVQWPVATIGTTGGPPIVGGQSAAFDLWFQRLTERLRAQGFHNLERLVPHDMFLLAHQPLYRYSLAEDRFPIVQLGHGIFTVNAGPPNYRSWAALRPQVEKAFAALVDTKPTDEPPTTFSRVALRYIDLFDTELRAGASNYAFIRDDLGISIGLPDGLIELASDAGRIYPTLAVQLPIDGDQNANMTFQVAAGRLGNRSSTDTVMDMSYVVSGNIPVATAAVLAPLDAAHTAIHSWFEKLTSNIRDRMDPIRQA
ncbi:TIGR04255 family protein [Thiocapsa sp.]|uniref:TIGR04255 family protein n=1 Tax=Thiocapsa sp. TaxID=2024551 RepID=UPI002BF57580|nr:TIGR04255 family protein [Thiocapsa sp.]HSO82083.1 TIGR04255 family protein [Thiocapsa sp.]